MGGLSIRATGTVGVVAQLDRFRVNIGHARPALEGMADVVSDAQRHQFTTEGGHYGPRWASLSPAYKAWKARRRPGRKILVFDGALKAQAAPLNPRNFGFYQVTGRRMEVGVDYGKIPYAKYHQEGTAKMPARPIMGAPTRTDVKAMTKILHEHIIRGVAGARG